VAASVKPGWLTLAIVLGVVPFLCALVVHDVIFCAYGNGHFIPVESNGTRVLHFWTEQGGMYLTPAVVAFSVLVVRRAPLVAATAFAALAALSTFVTGNCAAARAGFSLAFCLEAAARLGMRPHLAAPSRFLGSRERRRNSAQGDARQLSRHPLLSAPTRQWGQPTTQSSDGVGRRGRSLGVPRDACREAGR